MQEIMQFVGRHPMLSIARIALLVAVPGYYVQKPDLESEGDYTW